jgi:hypothetical protein
MVSRDLTKVLNDRYFAETQTWEVRIGLPARHSYRRTSSNLGGSLHAGKETRRRLLTLIVDVSQAGGKTRF